MSRKRAKDKRAEEAVPEEILAEGSGPNEQVDANPQTLVAAAQELVEKKAKGKRKGKAKAGRGEGVDAEASDVEAAADADVSAEASASDDVAAQDRATDDIAGEDHEEAAFDAAADNVAPESVEESAAEVVATAEGEAVAAVEDAVMRAEAEAELGDAEEIEAAEDEELGAALPTTAASMDAAQLKNLVEALVFAADKPLTIVRLRQLTRVSDVKRLEQALAEIGAEYQNRGIALQSVSGGFQFRTNTQYSVWVQQLIAGRPVRLSRAQLETLAIVAYRQPITRPEIDEIRGVDSSATLRLLLDRSLIRTLGKKEEVGRPMLYGTTKEFLDFFSLGDLRELPTLREYSELTAESRKVMSDRLGVEPGEGEGEGTESGEIGDAGETSSGASEDPADAVAAVAAVDSSAHLAAEEADSTPGTGESTVADGDEDATVHASSTPGRIVRDGVEYDRWGQPLGPIVDELAGDAAAGEDNAAEEDDAAQEDDAVGQLDAAAEVDAAAQLDAATEVDAAAQLDAAATGDTPGDADAAKPEAPDGAAAGEREPSQAAGGLEPDSMPEQTTTSEAVASAPAEAELGAVAGASIEERANLDAALDLDEESSESKADAAGVELAPEAIDAVDADASSTDPATDEPKAD